jgi:hypothetical protein
MAAAAISDALCLHWRARYLSHPGEVTVRVAHRVGQDVDARFFFR